MLKTADPCSNPSSVDWFWRLLCASSEKKLHPVGTSNVQMFLPHLWVIREPRDLRLGWGVGVHFQREVTGNTFFKLIKCLFETLFWVSQLLPLRQNTKTHKYLFCFFMFLPLQRWYMNPPGGWKQHSVWSQNPSVDALGDEGALSSAWTKAYKSTSAHCGFFRPVTLTESKDTAGLVRLKGFASCSALWSISWQCN